FPAPLDAPWAPSPLPLVSLGPFPAPLGPAPSCSSRPPPHTSLSFPGPLPAPLGPPLTASPPTRSSLTHWAPSPPSYCSLILPASSPLPGQSCRGSQSRSLSKGVGSRVSLVQQNKSATGLLVYVSKGSREAGLLGQCFFFNVHLRSDLLPSHKLLLLQLLLRYLFHLRNFLFWLRNNLFLLSEDHLNMTGGAHVGVDTTMSSVGTPVHFGGLVDLDTLELNITLSIFEHMQKELCTLLRPPHLCPAPLLGLSTSADSTIVTTEGNTLLFQGHILQIFSGFLDMHAIDSLGCLTSVLEVDSKVRNPLTCMIWWGCLDQVSSGPFSELNSRSARWADLAAPNQRLLEIGCGSCEHAPQGFLLLVWSDAMKAAATRVAMRRAHVPSE
uniref:Uncharacterized protein n=1 Tax=Pelusios castaneus TaxID=367368 RepID=A0A8C8SRL7_9SAUR